ncbi:tetratricopeptide repeat protein, partial [Bacteroidota bacterium]
FMVLGIAPEIQAQQDEENSIRNSPIYRIQAAVYNRAIKYSDVNQAITALYNMCVLDPQNDSILYNLAFLYFDQQNYISSVMTLNDVMMLNSNNLNAQEMKAISLDRLGAKDKALEEYESLYLKNNDINFLYKVAFSQYELKRFKECITNINIMLEGSVVDEELLIFADAENQQQEIPMRASLLNLRALVEQDQGNKEEARRYFNEALEIAPEFYLGKENLKKLDE